MTPSVRTDKYRPDIDGLRAVAVGSVVVYHAFPPLAPGGFVGVDVFFVISGYLITQILADDLAKGRYSLLEFYKRRILRILPALALVLLFCCLAADRLMLADEFDAFARALVAGASLTANIAFWRSDNYFDGATKLQPLMHLWSLGVEEQFYILWPVALAAARRLRIPALWIAAATAAISLVLAVQATAATPVAAFFAPQYRAWELMAGALLALTGRLPLSPRWADAGSLLAAALLGYSIALTDARAFPGLAALPPVLGAALVIACGPKALFNRLALSRRGFVWVGLISYPLYLWHWPLLSLTRIVEAAPPGVAARLVCVAAAVALAWATNLYVERPIRFGARQVWKPLTLTASLLGFAAFGFAVEAGAFASAPMRDDGRAQFARAFENAYPDWRFNRREDIWANFRLDCNFYDPAFMAGAATQVPVAAIAPSCYQRDPAKRRVVFLWGDSHAQMLYAGLRDALPDDWQILIVASSGCEPDPTQREDSPSDYCRRSNSFALGAIRDAKPDVVLVAQVSGHRYEAMRQAGDALRGLGAGATLFTGPVPQWNEPLPAIEQRRLWAADPARTWDGLMQPILASNQRLRDDFAHARDDRFVDLIGFFCDDQGCLTRVGPDRLKDFVTFDYGHLTPEASRYLARGLLARRVVEAARERSLASSAR